MASVICSSSFRGFIEANVKEMVHQKNWGWIILASIPGLFALLLRIPDLLANAPLTHLTPWLATLAFGAGIVGSAFLLTWALETAQLDISKALALAVVAFVAVLPEYSIDLYLAWKAGGDPLYASYAAANMTGANRLLVGVGWPLVALVFWAKSRGPLHLGTGVSLPLTFLGAASLYSFLVFFRGSISLWDTAALVGLFIAYIWLSARAERSEPDLVGPSALLGALPKRFRRTSVLVLFAYAALVIVLSAPPFVEGLIHGGREAGIDEFILVQWIAPLASESPEILIAIILTLRGDAVTAMMALISAKVNQWTLLVGFLPAVYSISLSQAASLPLDARQANEFLLTSAQSLFAVVLLAHMRLSWKGALVLLVLFTTQLAMPTQHARQIFAYFYLGATLAMAVSDRQRITQLVHMGRMVVAEAMRRSTS